MCNKTLVILAKSIKHGKYCVAGKDIISKQWVRLVSDRSGTELSSEQVKTTNRNWSQQGKPPYEVKPLQRVNVNFDQKAPLPHQPENEIIAPNALWEQHYQIQPSELVNFQDAPIDLWGQDNKVPYHEIQTGNISIRQSLYLISATDISLYKNHNDKRRMDFSYNNYRYTDMSVTSMNFDELISIQSCYNSAYLVISLGEEFNGHCYKIIASIFMEN